MHRSIPASLVLLVVTTVACGTAAGPSALSPLPESAAPASESSPPDIGGAAPATAGPFGRHDTPPGGVADFLEFGGGAGGFCGRVGSGPPSVWLGLNSLPAAVCAFDFAPGKPVDLILRRSGVAEWRNQVVVDEEGVGEWDLTDLPDPIEGDYTMLATQGEMQAERTQTLEVDTLETMLLPNSIRIGETTRLVVAGGLPLASMPAYLYYAPEEGFIGPDDTSGYRFVADIGPLELNANGEGRIALTPQPGDPVGLYMIIVNPREAGPPTPEPSLPPLVSVSEDDLTALAESYGMTCAGSDGSECDGVVGGVGVRMSILIDDSGRLIGAYASADAPSDDVLPMFGAMARIAARDSEAEDWVRSATQWGQRRFGDATVTLLQDLSGTRDVSVEPFEGSPTREVTATFGVGP